MLAPSMRAAARRPSLAAACTWACTWACTCTRTVSTTSPWAGKEHRERIRQRDEHGQGDLGLDDAAILRAHAEAARDPPVRRPRSAYVPVDVQALAAEMGRRRRRTTYDFLYPTHGHMLNLALFDFLPPEARAGRIAAEARVRDDERFMLPARLACGVDAPILPHGHHLVYFPLQRPASGLLADGTDPGQSPGPPFVRRMWAGGLVRWRHPERMQMDGRRIVCIERIDPASVRAAGAVGEERVFVDVWRRYGAVDAESGAVDAESGALEDEVEADPAVEERRTLVFLRARDDVPLDVDVATKARKLEGAVARVVRHSATPSYSFTLTPTRELLFQFSALSYNTHAIHLDSAYTRDVEGHAGLLVQGPLCLVLMLSALRAQAKGDSIVSTEYRNLAPLYAGRALRVCVRPLPLVRSGSGLTRAFHKWEMWIEDDRGSLCVRGTATTCGCRTGQIDELDETVSKRVSS